MIARLLNDAGPPRLRRPKVSPFEALVQAIVYQQLAGTAAWAIHGRLIAAMPDGVRPEALLALTDAELRTVGLSASLRVAMSRAVRYVAVRKHDA